MHISSFAGFVCCWGEKQAGCHPVRLTSFVHRPNMFLCRIMPKFTSASIVHMESDCYALIVECLSGYIISNVSFNTRHVVSARDQVRGHDKHKMSVESSTKQTTQSNISITRANGKLFILDGETEPTISLVGKIYSSPERDRVIPSTIRK